MEISKSCLPSRVPSRMPSRMPSGACVKLGTPRGILEGRHEGRQNRVSTRSAWPRLPPPPRDCKGDRMAGLRPDPTPPTTWVVGSVLRLVVRRLKRGEEGAVGAGFLGRLEVAGRWRQVLRPWELAGCS